MPPDTPQARQDTQIPAPSPTAKFRPKNTPYELIYDYRKRGLTMPQIAQLCHVHESAIYRMIERHGDVEDVERWKTHRADIMSAKQRELLSHITPDRIKKMNPRDMVVSFGILYDKERLERGLSTDNVDVHVLETSHNDLSAQRDAILQRLHLHTDSPQSDVQ
mgnify:FL=1